MDLEQKFKKETGLDTYIDNDLQPKIPLGYYVEWLEEQLRIASVDSQRELLKAFQEYYQSDNMDDEKTFDWNIDEFLEAFNRYKLLKL